MSMNSLGLVVAAMGYYGGYGYGPGFGMFYDPTYILVLIGVVISLIASAKVNSAFAKYNRVRSYSGLTGAQTAERILRSNGIMDVSIRCIPGKLTDHYDPSKKVVSLSESVYNGTSIAAIAVAAHECGHCLQHDTDYAPLNIRTALVPVANIGSSLSWVFIIIGILFGGSSLLINIGIILFSAAVAFQVVTLPVEFNASRRALGCIESMGILRADELKGGKKVLRAAALTYVAATLTAILQLLRLIFLFGKRDD